MKGCGYLNQISLIEDINNARKSINNFWIDYLFDINATIDSLTNDYHPSLLNLISALKSNQNDTNFPDLDGKAIGEYLKLKGYSKQDIEILVSYIFKNFE